MFFSDMDKNGIVEVAQNGNANELLQQEHYYPFGMGIKGEWKFVQPQIGGVNAYQYNGKELNDDFGLNWNDYGARWYDASIARWNGVDQLSEKYSSMSPYNYVLGNPINAIDPDGKDVIFANSASEEAFNRIYGSANENTRARLDALKGSDVMYEINTQAASHEMVDSRAEAHTLPVFDVSSQAVIAINIQDGQSEGDVIQALGDELEHAHQFETGQIGYELLPNGEANVFAYDMQDEIDSKKGAVLALHSVNKKEGTSYKRTEMHDDFISAMGRGSSGMQGFFKKYIAYNFDGSKESGKRTTAEEKSEVIKSRFEEGAINQYMYRAKNTEGKFETKRQSIHPILILLLILSGSLRLKGQNLIKTEKKQEYYIIKGLCEQKEILYDTLHLFGYKQYKIKVINKDSYYFLWKVITSRTNTYFLQKRTLISNCQFKYGKVHWCNQKYFSKKLRQNRYLKLQKKGIVMLFKDGSRRKISFEQLEKEMLQDMLKQGEEGIPPRE